MLFEVPNFQRKNIQSNRIHRLYLCIVLFYLQETDSFGRLYVVVFFPLFLFEEGVGFEPTCPEFTRHLVFKTSRIIHLSQPSIIVVTIGFEPMIFSV